MVRHEASAAGTRCAPVPLPMPGERRRGGAVKREPSARERAGTSAHAPSGEPLTPPSEAYQRGQDFIARCIAGDPGTRDEFVVEYSGLIRFAIAAVLRHRGVTLLREE